MGQGHVTAQSAALPASLPFQLSVPDIFLKNNNLIYFLLFFSLLHGFSIVVASNGSFLLSVLGLLLAVAFPAVEHRLWGTWGSVAVAPGL